MITMKDALTQLNDLASKSSHGLTLDGNKSQAISIGQLRQALNKVIEELLKGNSVSIIRATRGRLRIESWNEENAQALAKAMKPAAKRR
jgi:hypothetical protein